jgi:hypothetical protein
MCRVVTICEHIYPGFGLSRNFVSIGFGCCRRFDPGGVPGPTSKLSPRAPAQMGRCETEREGGKPEGDRRKGETRGLRVVPCRGRVRLQ